jgi:hypothetical protein
MPRLLARPSVSGVPIKASRQLKLLQDRYANVLADVKASHMDRHCTDGRSVRDVIGLVLIDLDRLASTAAFRPDGVPGYASSFLDRRLAGRWAARYDLEAVAAEAERRFVKARATAPDRPSAEYEQAVARLAVHCRDLVSAIRHRAPGA